jgi:hypothetical protein
MSIIVGVCAVFAYVNSNTTPVNQLPIKDYTIIGDSVDASVTTTTSTTTSSTNTNTTTTATTATNTTTTKGKTTTNTTGITTNTSTNTNTTTVSVNTIAVDTDDEATLTNTETIVENVEETYADTYDDVYDTSADDVTYYEEPDVITYDEQPVETYIESVETSTETPTEQTVVNEPVEESNNGGMTLLGNLRITGYVAYDGAHTANGDVPYVGGVAMSTSYGLPYGTTIYIEGLGYYTLNDTGCAYGVVDVFCYSVGDCYNLPAYCNVYVIN